MSNATVYALHTRITVVNYQKPVHELLNDVAVEIQNIVEVNGECLI